MTQLLNDTFLLYALLSNADSVESTDHFGFSNSAYAELGSLKSAGKTWRRGCHGR